MAALEATQREKRCSVEDCDQPCHARNLCSRHYARWHNFGDPLYPPQRVTGSPLRPFCPRCPDGGATVAYDCDERGWPLTRYCIRCRTVTPIEERTR